MGGKVYTVWKCGARKSWKCGYLKNLGAMYAIYTVTSSTYEPCYQAHSLFPCVEGKSLITWRDLRQLRLDTSNQVAEQNHVDV